MASNAPAADAGGPSRLVLVVDDDPGIRAMLVDVLGDGGLAVAEAEHGAAALDFLATHTPAVILLDMRMPVMDGWQFALAYRALPGPRVPILVMTASRDACRWCEEIGGDGWLGKPFDFDALHREITRLAA